MARQEIGRALVSIGALALVLAGAIVAVKTLSDRDAITLMQGIAVFAILISVWIAMVVWLWSAWLVGRRDGATSPERQGQSPWTKNCQSPVAVMPRRQPRY